MPLSRRLMATRACDSCRHRKVRCDTAEVCSNCRISQLACHYTSTPKKRGPRGPRNALPRNEASQHETPAQDNHVMVPLWSTPNASELPTAPQPGPLAHQSAEIEQSPAAKSAQTTRDALMNLMSSALLSLPALEVVNRCIYLYMQYTFPMAPIVHEPTLRKFAVRYFGTSPAELFRAGTYEEEVANMRSFALLTGLCASVASVIPESLLSYRYLIAQPFLDASREVLRLFEDYDVEYPSSASIATRIFHTVALQHITGKARLTYHILGQAALIVSNMRLYSEKALKVHEALECQLLRHVYWQIYAADQASACLRNRPFHLHELLYDEEPTICSPGTEPVIPQLDITQPWYNETVEGRLLIGFHFIPRLWSSAAKVILDVRAHGKRKQDADKKQLTQEYMDFLSIMDGLPYWLQAANIIAAANDEDAAQFQKTAFWVQRCTIQITFQCLRLVILQQCIDSELWDIMGLNGEPLALQLTKIGIVHDFVQTLDDIPFIYLQVKGEPTVERIRRVGSILLETLDQAINETIKVRAEHYFRRLLDILARLNSKSSDVLI